jgi:hypothetical protein
MGALRVPPKARCACRRRTCVRDSRREPPRACVLRVPPPPRRMRVTPKAHVRAATERAARFAECARCACRRGTLRDPPPRGRASQRRVRAARAAESAPRAFTVPGQQSSPSSR